MRNIRGIALVQVLIITIVMSILGLLISQSIKQQIKVTANIQESIKYEMAIESAEAELVQTLLSHDRFYQEAGNTIAQRWNFYGKEFSINEQVNCKLQDLNGLLGLNMMSNSLAENAFAQLGKEGHEVRIFLDSLNDWIDEDNLNRLNGAEAAYYRSKELPPPRNGYLQSIEEVLAIKGANMLPFEKWQKYFTHHYVTGFNPLTAPELLISALINNEEKTNQVITARENAQLNSLKFYQITGIDGDEYYNFATGRKIKVELLANVDNLRMSKSFVIEVSPLKSLRPVIITDVLWNNL